MTLFRCFDNVDLNVPLKDGKKIFISLKIRLWLLFSMSLLIAGLQVTSRRAMLVVKNKSISPLWELNSIVM